MKKSDVYKYALLATVQKMMVDGVDDADALYEGIEPLVKEIGTALFTEERAEEKGEGSERPRRSRGNRVMSNLLTAIVNSIKTVSSERILFRYMIGTIVETAVLITAVGSAVLAVICAVGYGLEWLSNSMPDWMILPMLLLVFGLGFFVTFSDRLLGDKRTIRGYRCTVYPQEKEVDAA